MSLQKTNLTDPRTGSGWQLRAPSSPTRCLPIAVRNTVEFALLALIFGYPVPLVARGADERAAPAPGSLLRARLPAGGGPAGGRGAALEVLLRPRPQGVFNTVLGWVGLGPFPWLQSATWAMPSLVLEATWAAAGATVIIYLAALISVPPELYDAAEVDGASVWRKIWHVTLPQLRGVLLITLILQIIGTAQVFLEPFLFTNGGPNNATDTIMLLIYNFAFGSSLGSDFGQATALSLMLAAFLGVMSWSTSRVTRSWSKLDDDPRRPAPVAASRRPHGVGGAASRRRDWTTAAASARTFGCRAVRWPAVAAGL